MPTQPDRPFFARRLNRRAFASRALAAGSLLALNARAATPTAAATFGPGDVVVTTSDANHRDAPGLSSTVLAVLPGGTTGTVEDDGTNQDGHVWYRVQITTGGVTVDGYIAGDVLALATTGPTYAVGDQVMVATDALNVRSQAGFSGTVIGVEHFGATGTVTQTAVMADGYSWIQVKFSDVTGWVVAIYVVPATSGGITSGGNFSIGEWVTVSSGPLNMRATPSLSGTIIHTLSTGDQGLITDGPVSADGYTWYQLLLTTGVVGWVVQDFLTASSSPPAGNTPSVSISIGDTIQVTDGPLNIRSGPSGSSIVIDRAANGAIAIVIDGPTMADGHAWIKINGNQLEVGWVAAEFCTIV